MGAEAVPATLDPHLAVSGRFADAVRRHVDGVATDEDMRCLQSNEKLWVRALYRLLDDIAESIDNPRTSFRGQQRAPLLADLEDDYRAVDAVLEQLVGLPHCVSSGDGVAGEGGNNSDYGLSNTQPNAASVCHAKRNERNATDAKLASSVSAGTVGTVGADEADDYIVNVSDSDSDTDDAAVPVGVELQLSWIPGHIIAWAAGPADTPSKGNAPNVQVESTEQVLQRLHASGANTVEWNPHRPVKLKNGVQAEALSARLDVCLGWLVALGDSARHDGVGVSVSWIGLVAVLAVRLTAQGRMVPQVKKVRSKPTTAHTGDRADFSVRWVPALIEAHVLQSLALSLPGAAAVFENQREAHVFTKTVLTDMVNAIATQAVSRIDVAAAPPVLRTRSDVVEASLARLDGTVFEAPASYAFELGRRLDQWHRAVRSEHSIPLTLQLNSPDEKPNSPDENSFWQLSVLSEASDGELQPVERELTVASRARQLSVKRQLVRLERLCPELVRLGGRRRGEVLLNSDEAWRLITETGEMLTACGYVVKSPEIARRSLKPALRITAIDSSESDVGAEQLANVRWSVVVDDLELSVEDIRELAQQAKPLVKSRGRWMELDHSDLNATAQALEERVQQTQMSGVDMLRHALGLEMSPLPGSTSIAGHGWAVDLISSAEEIPDELPLCPEGFVGRLRHYQADALVWLEFLLKAGLGGCLALDMGLGKTPIMLAHIRRTLSDTPSLVVAPPAVVSNWHSEASRFVPDLRVEVHHGPNRCPVEFIPKMARNTDLVITTYGTAMRDMDMLEKVRWRTVIVDEAQAIKNHNGETARQLRRLPGFNRVTLTGTPIENGLGDLWSIMDFCNPGLLGLRSHFIGAMNTLAENTGDTGDTLACDTPIENTGITGDTPVESTLAGNSENGRRAMRAARSSVSSRYRPDHANLPAEGALAALNGLLVFRRTKLEPAIANELPDRIDEIDHCTMTHEQIGMYQAVLNQLAVDTAASTSASTDYTHKKGVVLAAITALKQICNHPLNYREDSRGVAGRSGKLTRLEEILEQVFSAGERALIFTHFAMWGERLSTYLSELSGLDIACYHGGLARGSRDRLVEGFQRGKGAGALVLSLKAGGTGLNLTAANHVILYDRWWNPAAEDQARDRAWRIGQRNTVVCHLLMCPGTVDERVEKIVAGKRHIANVVLPKSSSIGDLDSEQLQTVLGIDVAEVLVDGEG